METCPYTGYCGRGIERHHIFGGANRSRSELYGFVLPLAPWVHPNGARFDEKMCKATTGRTRREIDLHMKQWAQTYFEMNIGSRERFMNEFGRSWK